MEAATRQHRYKTAGEPRQSKTARNRIPIAAAPSYSSLLRPAPAGLSPASPAASGRQALAASSCGRHLHRQRPAVDLQRPHPLDLIFSFYFLDLFPFFIFVSHSFVLYRLLIQGPKV
jgi:hypothetical protein